MTLSQSPPLPQPFVHRLHTQWAAEEVSALCRAINRLDEATVSLRVNPLKPVAPKAGWRPVAWCDGGYCLTARPDFTADPLFHAGCYYVQEAASMAVAVAYEAMETKPALLLDLCAAPGGKSTLWRSLMPSGALLVANEPVHNRAMILRENVQKWGHPDVLVTASLPENFGALYGLFDAVAADVPCSGEGMFRKDPDARSLWSEENAARCVQRQREIVRQAWQCLREGGYLVYSTCTFNPAENEENVRWICRELGAEVIRLDTNRFPSILNQDGMLHFLPHRTVGEGFFLALIRKTASQNTLRLRRTEKTTAVPHGWIKEEKDFVGIRQTDGTICGLRTALLPHSTAIRAAVRTIATGVEVAQPKGHKLQPAHALALSTLLNKDNFPKAELTREESLRYLSRQSLTLSPSLPRGFVVATYENHPIGFLNNLGTRANNLYPTEWRIRKTII